MKPIFKPLILSCCLFLTVAAYAQADRVCYLKDTAGHTREHNFDVTHILIDIAFAPDSGKVFGTVEHSFTPLQKDVDTIFMDAPGIDIKEVLLDKVAVPFTTDKKGLTVRFSKTLHWDEQHVLSIRYEAHPRKGLYFIGWNDPHNMSRKQIWTQGEGIDNRYWLPSFDDQVDKSTVDMIVHFDKDYKVLSNGVLVEEKLEKDKKNKVWHYKMEKPFASYLIMLGIGDYAVRTTKTKTGVTINNWYYPQYPETVEPTFIYTEDMMDFLQKETGIPYPWPAYSQIPVQDFMYGAMENVTATVFGDFLLVDKRGFLDRNYIGVNIHEMTHQYFGDYITTRNDAHEWLHESFATHYDQWFERSIFGEDHFQWLRRGELQGVQDAAKANNNPIVYSTAGTARIYPKGSLVLDMIKYLIGKDQYDHAVNYYLKKHAFSNVDTHDFEIAFLESLGINLDWFFDEWLYHGGEPHYQVSYIDVPKSAGKDRFTQVTVRQTQIQDGLVGLFKMPIVFEVYYKDGSSSQVKQTIEKETEEVMVPNAGNKDIDYVLFDPNSWIIKFVDFKKGTDELKAQASKAKNMIDRYDALVGLESKPWSEKKQFLSDLYSKESFWANRQEIVKQLVGKIDSIDPSLVRQFIKDAHARVRQAVIDNTDKIPASLLADYETLLKDSSYVNEENALLKLCTQYPENTSRYLDITKNDVGGIPNKLRVTWLEIAAGVDRSKYIPQLVEYVSNSHEFRARGYACAALQRLNYLDQKELDYMVDCVLSPNTRLAQPAITALNYFKGQTGYKKMLKEYYASHKWTDWQDDLVRPVLN